MKKSLALSAAIVLATSTFALAQMGNPSMSQAQKDEMARQKPIPGSTTAGGSTPNVSKSTTGSATGSQTNSTNQSLNNAGSGGSGGGSGGGAGGAGGGGAGGAGGGAGGGGGR